jgi:hypothetical protein
MKNNMGKIKLMALAILITLVGSFLPGLTSNMTAKEFKIENANVMERSTEVTVTWQTSEAATTEIWYGETQSYGTIITGAGLTRDHVIVIRALDAGTRYFYQIVAQKGGVSGEKLTYADSFETIGTKQNLTVYQSYFATLFDNAWKNINGVNPYKINNVDGLDFFAKGFVGQALKINRADSYLEYSCQNVFDSANGAVTAWVAFDRFDKNSVIWQTDDSRYALYYEVGGIGADFDKRIVARAGGKINKTDFAEVDYVLDPRGALTNIWGTNEWHFLALTWTGKFNGTLNLFIDGRRVGEANYSDGTNCSTFRVGNNYREDMSFSIGRIDELKIHQWGMPQYYVYQNYLAYASNANFNKKGTPDKTIVGQIAGAAIRKFKVGKMLKAGDGKIYLIGRDNELIHVSDIEALGRLGGRRVAIEVTEEELAQYTNNGKKFYSWSRYPDGTMLKGSDKTVYWIWDGEKRPLFSEETFKRYDNDWNDLVVVTDSELGSYPTGFMYY